MLQTLTISICAGVIEPDTKPHIPEDGTSPAQVKTEDDCKAECVDSAGEDDDLDDETDKSFDPIEDRRRSRSICYGITKLDLESSIIRAVNGSTWMYVSMTMLVIPDLVLPWIQEIVAAR